MRARTLGGSAANSCAENLDGGKTLGSRPMRVGRNSSGIGDVRPLFFLSFLRKGSLMMWDLVFFPPYFFHPKEKDGMWVATLPNRGQAVGEAEEA